MCFFKCKFKSDKLAEYNVETVSKHSLSLKRGCWQLFLNKVLKPKPLAQTKLLISVGTLPEKEQQDYIHGRKTLNTYLKKYREVFQSERKYIYINCI